MSTDELLLPRSHFPSTVRQDVWMIDRTKPSSTDRERVALLQALRTGVGTMVDPLVETRLVAHFVKNPNYSRDANQVAAAACRIQNELPEAGKVRVQVPVKNTVSHSN